MPRFRKQYRHAATLADLRIGLSYVREAGYNPVRFGQDCDVSPRAVRWWNQTGVPRVHLALAVALTKLTPGELRDWREELRFLRSG